MILFCFLSVEFTIFPMSTEFIQVFDNLRYGYKKNAIVNIQLNSSIPITFGLAAKQELEIINSLNDDFFYCNGTIKLAKIQFLVNKSISEQFTIASKSILTPFFVSCVPFYKSYMELVILNGRFHSDYIIQNLMISVLFFSIFAI